MYHVKTNAPGIPPETAYPTAGHAVDALKLIPEGWQASVEYCGCQIWYGMVGETPLPDAARIIRGACGVNGVD